MCEYVQLKFVQVLSPLFKVEYKCEVRQRRTRKEKGGWEQEPICDKTEEMKRKDKKKKMKEEQRKK